MGQGHSGMKGNDKADQAAKEARSKPPKPPRIDYFNIIQRDRKERKEARHHIGFGKGKIVDLPRKTATIYTYLRTNRGPFNSWLKTIGKVETDICEKHQLVDDAKHRLLYHLDEIDWIKDVGTWEELDRMNDLMSRKVFNILPTAFE